MAPFFKKPKYSTIKGSNGLSPPRKEIPSGLWEKCTRCAEVTHKTQLAENLQVCPNCNFHQTITYEDRLELLVDEGTFEEKFTGFESYDFLNFDGPVDYGLKLEENKKKTNLEEAVVCGDARINGIGIALAIMDFRFLGASMGSVVGEKITLLIEYATEASLPLIIVTASGGARMYEGMMSLMQMAKTSGALARYQTGNRPYITVLTHPTTAGVSASFATLGDILIAEPGALIGFAGPRVIKQTTSATLPEGFQTAEFLLEKGLIDRIIERKDLKDELTLMLKYFGL